MGKLGEYSTIICNLRNKGLSFDHIVEELSKEYQVNTARSTVISEYKRAMAENNVLPKNETIDEEEIERITDEPLYKILSRYTTNDILPFLQEVQLTYPHKPLQCYKPGAISKGMIISDVHTGKLVVGQEDEILYDSNLMVLRLQHLAESFIHSCKTSSRPIDEIFILLIGDIVENEVIFPGQSHQIDIPVFKQTELSRDTLWKHVMYPVAMEFQDIPINIYCVPGNHARPGNDRQASKISNWDNVIYSSLSAMLGVAQQTGTMKNVSLVFSLKDYLNFQIRGWKCHMRHSAPSQVETAAGEAKLGNWYKAHQMDMFFHGHWHRPGLSYWNGVAVFANGSVPGTDDYAEELALGCPACQTFLEVDDDKEFKKLTYELIYLE